MSKHTPGPWHIGARTFFRPTLTIFHKPFGLGDVAEVYEDADAPLIAAAPELLEALREVRKQARHPDYDWSLDLQREVDAAIAKATGEQV